MAKILLVSDPGSIRAEMLSEARGRVLVVHHKNYQPTRGPEGNWDAVAFDAVKDSSRDWLAKRDTLIFVGLTRAITPGSRMDMVWEILYNKTAGLTKISVDTHLFVAEPWRAWFPFGFTNTRYRDYAHSFVAETHYNQFIDGMRQDDPFSLNEIVRWGRGVVASDHRRSVGEIQVSVIPASAADRKAYVAKKEECFAEERSPKRIVARLEDFASSICPERSVPPVRAIWAATPGAPIRIIATDLPVDLWLASRLRHLADLSNGIAEGFYVGND